MADKTQNVKATDKVMIRYSLHSDSFKALKKQNKFSKYQFHEFFYLEKLIALYFYLGSKLDDCDDLEFSLEDNKSGGIRIFNSRFSCQFLVLPNVELSTKW